MVKKVKKRGGSLQDYTEKKVRDGLNKAGATVGEAQKVAGKVTEWVEKTAKEGIVSSANIGKKVIEYTKEINEAAAANFRKFFDKTPEKGKKKNKR